MKKRIVSLAMAAVLAGSLCGCGAAKEESKPSADAPANEVVQPAKTGGLAGDPSETYYMNVFVSGVEYWYPVYAGMKDACKQLGVSCSYGGTTDYDPQAQVESFESMVSMDAAGVLVSPITAEAFHEPINNAVASGVPVVTFASDSPDSKRQAYITSDNENEGKQAAIAIATALNGSGKVMVLRNPGQTNHDVRCNSFIETIEKDYPGIEVVADEPTNQTAETAYSAVMTVSQLHPDLGAVFSPESVSAAGAVQANVELGGNIKVMCVDTSDELLDMLKTGDMFGIICPDQYLQGYFGMMSLFAAAHPENLNPMNGRKANGENPVSLPVIDNGLTIVSKETADYYYVSDYAKSIGYDSIEDMLGDYKAGE